jgi:hypothetical protein
MKKFLLIFLCIFLFTNCSSVVKNNTLVGVNINETEVETLPVTADLAVSEQKTKGEAIGYVTDIDILAKEAIAKALGQEPPSVDKPDVLVGINAFTEVDGANLKVVFTGYPAYYTNFRTATKADSLRLSMVNAAPNQLENKLETRDKPDESEGEWYFSVKYQFGDGFGWGIGAGKSWPSNLLHGDFFIGGEIEEGGLLSPWKDDDKDWDYMGLGGSLNIGVVYEELPNDLKLVGGLSAGFWYSNYDYESSYYYDYGYGGYYVSDYYSYDSEDIMIGPFVKVRWHGLEAGIRLLFGSDSDFQFALGYTF